MAIEGFSIKELTARISDAGAKWEAGETQFTQMSSAERSRYLGYIPGPGEPSLEEQESKAKANLKLFTDQAAGASYPSSYDLRNVDGKNYITPVKNQGGCGSCVAFGVVATAEGMFRWQHDNPNLSVDFSEAHLYFCNDRKCSSGWWSHAALDFLRDSGIVDEACYPYQAVDQACEPCTDFHNRLKKITGWQRITSTSEMKKWISTKGPLVANYTVYDDFYAYQGGIYRHITGDHSGGHCISVVGYDDDQQYWICKNSWGNSFGEENPYDPGSPKEKGYFRIAYGECGIDDSMNTIDSFVSTKLVGIKALCNNKYVCAEDAGAKPLIANRDWIRGWEKFEVIDKGNNKIALKACNGKYVCAEDAGNKPLIANRDWIRGWEIFEYIDKGGNKFALKACNGKYVCAEDAGNKPLIANRDWIKGWEMFSRVLT